MPVLDTQMWVKEQSRERGIPQEFQKNATKQLRMGDLKPIICYKFYKKPIANKCPNLRRSGLQEGSKKNTAVQEVIRRLKNTSRELGIQKIEPIVIEYMSELAMGGYSHTWRIDVLQAGIKGSSRMWASKTDGKG